MAEQSPAARGWPATVAVAACVALELAVASSSIGAATRVTALLGLAAVAVALALRQTLQQSFAGLALSRRLRAAIVGPILFSIVLAVVLMLDAHARGGSLL